MVLYLIFLCWCHAWNSQPEELWTPLFVASQLLRTTVSNTSSSHLRASLRLRPNSATIQAGIIIIIAPLSQTRHTRTERGKRYITLRYVTSVRPSVYASTLL